MGQIRDDAFPFTDRGVLEEAPRKYLGMSEIGFCARKMGYRYLHANGLGVEPGFPFGLRDFARMGRGTVLESFVVKLLEACGYRLHATGDNQLELELELGTGDFMRGHPDGVVSIDPLGLADGWLLEIKTMSQFPFKALPKRGIPEYYKDQASLYMEADGAPGMMFVFFEPGSGDMVRIDYPEDQERALRLLARAGRVAEVVGQGSPSPLDIIPTPVAGWECNGCGWRNVCPMLDRGQGES